MARHELVVVLFAIAAVVCFAVAWLMSAGWMFSDHGHNISAWGYAGLTALAAASLPWARWLRKRP